jgi:hypothetical protein
MEAQLQGQEIYPSIYRLYPSIYILYPLFNMRHSHMLFPSILINPKPLSCANHCILLPLFLLSLALFRNPL